MLLPTRTSIALHGLFTLLRRVGRARHREPPIEFLLNQRGILEQPNDFGPDDLIQQVLPDWSVGATGPAEVPPRIRAEAPIVVNQAGTRPGRGAREGVAAPAATHQPLHEARRDGASPRADFVLVQQFLRARKGRLVDERRHRESRSTPRAVVRDWRCCAWSCRRAPAGRRVTRWRGATRVLPKQAVPR